MTDPRRCVVTSYAGFLEWQARRRRTTAEEPEPDRPKSIDIHVGGVPAVAVAPTDDDRYTNDDH